MVLEKGKLVRWLDDKGFGFIKPENGGNDIFIHILALKGMNRKPIIGDVIHYQIGFDKSSKTHAINAWIKADAQNLERMLRFVFLGEKTDLSSIHP